MAHKRVTPPCAFCVSGQERLFPFDPLPRVITAQEFQTLDKGLVQRVNALNLFLKDVYGDKKIIRDGIVPEDFVFAGSGYLPQCEGFVPPKGVYSHISGIDLVQAKDGSWFILEDNLRIPSGVVFFALKKPLTTEHEVAFKVIRRLHGGCL